MPFASGLLLLRRESLGVLRLLSIHKRQGMTDLANKDTKATFRFGQIITYTEGERRSSQLPVVIVTHTQKTTKWRSLLTVTQAGGEPLLTSRFQIAASNFIFCNSLLRGKASYLLHQSPRDNGSLSGGHVNKKWPSQSNSHPLVFQENHKVFC